MGVVMGAVDTSLGRPVAIKFLPPQKVPREAAVARFLREARAAAAGNGAPSQVKDAGAPTPPRPSPEDERNAALGRAAEAQCANHRQQMTTFARDEASRKRAAAQAKAFMCRGMASSRCERPVCMDACLVLNDQPCVQQMKYVIDHGPAPKYCRRPTTSNELLLAILGAFGPRPRRYG